MTYICRNLFFDCKDVTSLCKIVKSICNNMTPVCKNVTPVCKYVTYFCKNITSLWYVRMLHIYAPNRHFIQEISYVLNDKNMLFDK